MFFPINFPRTAVRLRGDDVKNAGMTILGMI